jgi:hypothetical protein
MGDGTCEEEGAVGRAEDLLDDKLFEDGDGGVVVA